MFDQRWKTVGGFLSIRDETHKNTLYCMKIEFASCSATFSVPRMCRSGHDPNVQLQESIGIVLYCIIHQVYIRYTPGIPFR